MPTGNDTLWNATVGYGRTAPKLAYLDDAQNCRMERIRCARLLWKGWHKKFFIDEVRTQWDFPEMAVNGLVIKPYIPFNVLRLITTTLTDLLLGAEPILRVDDDLGQQAIDALKTRSDLSRIFYDAARTASWAGEAFVEVVRWQDQVYIQDVNVDEVFPVGERQPDGQFSRYVRFATAAINGGRTRLLLETTYLPGSITRACHQIDTDGKKAGAVNLAQWPALGADGKPLAEAESTGISWNTMIWMANELDEGNPNSDFDGLIGLQDTLNAKQTQIARVIAKHSDPKLAAPQTAADETGNLHANQSVYFYRTKDEIPTYITWNAELASAIEDRDFALNAMCIAAELSQGLLGIERGAAPDSARKLRLQATKALARTKRKSTFVRPFIKTALDTALMMMRAGLVVQVALGLAGETDGAAAGAGGMGGAAVDMQDGLPVDEQDQASQISMLRAAGAISIERAVRLQIPDEAAAQEEIDTIKEEAADAAPTVSIGPVGEGGGGGGGTQNAKDAENETQNGMAAEPAAKPVNQEYPT